MFKKIYEYFFGTNKVDKNKALLDYSDIQTLYKKIDDYENNEINSVIKKKENESSITVKRDINELINEINKALK